MTELPVVYTMCFPGSVYSELLLIIVLLIFITKLRQLNNDVMKVCYDNFWRSDEYVRLQCEFDIAVGAIFSIQHQTDRQTDSLKYIFTAIL